APRGEFVLAGAASADDGGAEPGRAVLLVSAGIGVTPVLAMLYELAAEHSQRDVWWIQTARGPNEHPLAGEAQTLLAALPNAREHLFYTAATPEECRRANATPGRVTEDALAAMGIPPAADAYVCGPAAFMDDMRDALTALGVEPAHFHTELFGATAAINPG